MQTANFDEEGGREKMEELYTVDEMMALLKVSRDTLYRYMSDGIVPFVQVEGKRRFFGSQVNKALKEMQKRQMIDSLRVVRKSAKSEPDSEVLKCTL